MGRKPVVVTYDCAKIVRRLVMEDFEELEQTIVRSNGDF